MAFIRLPLGIRVALEFDLAGKTVVNVYHVTTEDPIVTVKLIDIALVFVDWWANDLSLQLSEDMALFSVTALNMNVENGEKITQPVTPPEPGQVLEASVSNNVALVVARKTDKTGRSFQGRSYLAGLGEPAVTNNHILVTKAAAIGADYVILSGLLAAENADMVVASFESGGVPRSEGVATKVTSYIVNTRVDTQRRRLPKF